MSDELESWVCTDPVEDMFWLADSAAKVVAVSVMAATMSAIM